MSDKVCYSCKHSIAIDERYLLVDIVTATGEEKSVYLCGICVDGNDEDIEGRGTNA